MALIQCSDCDKQISDKAPSCPHCGAPNINHSFQQSIQTQSYQAPSSSRKEEVLFSNKDISITTSRAVLGKTTYAMRNITAVKAAKTDASFISKFLAGLGIVFFGLPAFSMIFSLLIALASADFEFFIQSLFGGFLMAGLTYLCLLWMRSLKAKYHVAIETSSGSVNAYSSSNEEHINHIVNKINEAIVRY